MYKNKKQENKKKASVGKICVLCVGISTMSITYGHPDTHALEEALQRKDFPERINTGTFSGSKKWLIKYLREERKGNKNKNTQSKQGLMKTQRIKPRKSEEAHASNTPTLKRSKTFPQAKNDKEE